MSDDHDHPHDHDHGHHHDHDHPHSPAPGPPPEVTEDTGTQALAAALRSSFLIVKFIMGGLVVVFLASGFFTVKPEQRAIILRLGKPVGEGVNALLGPGAHWAWPYPIDEIVKIPIGEIQKVTSSAGWYATTAAMEAAGNEPPPQPRLNPALDGYTLTADGNIIHVRATMRYRINDPVRFIFGFTNTPAFITNALNNALVHASARFTVDNALTRDITGFKEAILRRLNEVVQQDELGIVVDQLTVESIPPRWVKPAFASVLEAGFRQEKVLNDARRFTNEVLSAASAERQARIQGGITASNQFVQSVQAEAAKFAKLLPEYQRNPALFTHLRQLEATRNVLTNAADIWVVPDRADGKARTMWLQLSREIMKSKLPEPEPKDKH